VTVDADAAAAATLSVASTRSFLICMILPL
jgi:hypothetical protein